MLITADCYWDLYLKNKGLDIIREEIDVLAAEIGRLRRALESPTYEYESHPYPSEREQIEACYGYLQRAAEEFISRGGDIAELPTLVAERAMADRLPTLSCLSLRIGDAESYTLDAEGDSFSAVACVNGERTLSVLNKSAVTDKLAALHIDQWRSEYLPRDYGFVDPAPTAWELRLEFTDGGEPLGFRGLSIRPYNLSSLIELFK